MRFTLPELFLTLAVFTGCGGDDPPVQPDSPPVDPPATRITVKTEVPPALLAVRDGDGPWQAVATAGGEYELDVRGPYRVAVVCDYGDGFMDMLQVARTPDDDREILWPCLRRTIDQPVSGEMVQAGRVTLEFDSQSSTTPNFTFDLVSSEGTRELVAMTDDRIAIRREIQVAGTTAITPAIDVDLEGAPLVAAPFTVTNATDEESVAVSIRLLTTNETFVRVFSGIAIAARIAPTSVLAATDRQRTSINASTDAARRSVFRADFREGDSTSITLPEALGPVLFTQATSGMTATWSTLPANDFVDLLVDASSPDFARFWFHDVETSAAFIAATGATSATIDTEIPGFNPAWKIDFAQEFTRTVSATKFAGADALTSSVFETLNTPPDARVAPPARYSLLREKRAQRRELRSR